jgi:hypothetical protein
MQSYELARAHKKRSEISGETRFFGLVARPVRRAFHGYQGHNGIGRACNMKVCVVVSKSRLSEHILLFNSDLLSVIHVPPSLLLATFRVRGARSKNETPFFFPLLVQIEHRKASKAPKNRFSEKCKENTFFRCSASFHFGSSPVVEGVWSPP